MGFGSEPAFSIGIEEELLLVRPETFTLLPEAARVVAEMGVDESVASTELYGTEIELRSPPSRTAGDAAGALAGLRATATAAGATLIGVGVHPDAAPGESAHSVGARFRVVDEMLRGLVRLTPDAALHVHVSVPDCEAATTVANGLRLYVPLLVALSANSPYLWGKDSGFASARAMLGRAHPRRGIPPRFADYEHYQRTVEVLLRAAELEQPSFIWWDVRLRPDLGTVEVRAMDSQAPVRSVAGLAALIQGLAIDAAEGSASSDPLAEVLAESSFRAARDGIGARLLDDGTLRSVADLANLALERARSHVRGLGCEGALEEIERLLRDGGGAERSRAAHRSGGMRGVLAALVDDTADGPSDILTRA